MKIIIFRHTYNHSRAIENAFALGLQRHGIEPEFGDVFTPQDCDLAVFWAHRWDSVIEHQRRTGKDYLLMECGFIGPRTTQWFSLGFNGLNGRADFKAKGKTAERFTWHFPDLLKPWRTGGQYVLILGQVSGDQSIAGVNIEAFYKQARDFYDGKAPVALRPHPKDATGFRLAGADHPEGTLHECLDRALLAVTFNSNAGVDAALYGVPVVALDKGAMVWPVASHDLTAAPITLEREQWAAELAYSQWSLEEIEAGIAWEHLTG